MKIEASVKRADMLKAASLTCAATALPGAGSAPPAGNAADAQLAAFFDADWTHLIARSPETATFVGDHSGDDRWDDVSLAAQSADLADARDTLAKLERFDVSTAARRASAPPPIGKSVRISI